MKEFLKRNLCNLTLICFSCNCLYSLQSLSNHRALLKFISSLNWISCKSLLHSKGFSYFATTFVVAHFLCIRTQSVHFTHFSFLISTSLLKWYYSLLTLTVLKDMWRVDIRKGSINVLFSTQVCRMINKIWSKCTISHKKCIFHFYQHWNCLKHWSATSLYS